MQHLQTLKDIYHLFDHSCNLLGDRLYNGSPYAIRPLSVLPVCLVLSVCDVGVLWPNGWMDQDETWHAGRPRPWPHCVSWGPSSPSPKGGNPQFLAHICCGQMAGWIKMPLDMEEGLGPGDFVLGLHGDPAPPSPKRKCPLWSNGWMDQDGA